MTENCDFTVDYANEDMLYLASLADQGDEKAKTEMDKRLGVEPVIKSVDVVKGVPGPLEMERALSRLTILPNPNHPDLDEPEKFVESPWPVIPTPRVDPNAWDDAMVQVVDMDDLFATDPFMRRKNVKAHIETMGQATTPFRSFALIAVVAGRSVIIDGHHRLMALWLLGQNSAPAYVIEVE